MLLPAPCPAAPCHREAAGREASSPAAGRTRGLLWGRGSPGTFHTQTTTAPERLALALNVMYQRDLSVTDQTTKRELQNAIYFLIEVLLPKHSMGSGGLKAIHTSQSIGSFNFDNTLCNVD